VVVTTQPAATDGEATVEFVTDGHIHLDHSSKGRTLQVRKFRGSTFESGRHTMRIDETGVTVAPKLVPGDHSQPFVDERIASGVEGVDALLHGGLVRGTVTVISGPSGVGKTTLGTHFAKAAASRGERSVIYLFEEDTTTFDHRSSTIGVPVAEMRAQGTLATREIEPLAVSADEFAADVREEVERRDAEVVMIDGSAGYRLSIRGSEDDLVRELHALCRYLRRMGVTVILIEETDQVTGHFQPTRNDISYLADNIVFLRYLELDGELRKAIGVLKQRASDFERTLREFRITGDGLVVGEPLRGLQGALTGTPDRTDDAD
jgi:circadian clock protein KaiC